MHKIYITILFLFTFAFSSAVNAENFTPASETKQEQEVEYLDYSTLAYYGSTSAAGVILSVYLQMQYGLWFPKILKGVGGLSLAGGVFVALASAGVEPKKEKFNPKKTFGQLHDKLNFEGRFFNNVRSVYCEESNLGAYWSGAHSVLELQIRVGDKYSCDRFILEVTAGSSGIISMKKEMDDLKFSFPISDEEISSLKNWLVDFDRQNIPWSSVGNDCIDFIFKAFQAIGHETKILPWLGAWDTGYTSTKLHLLKYLATETFRKAPTDDYSFSPNGLTGRRTVLLVNALYDTFLNPFLIATTLPMDLVVATQKAILSRAAD